MRNLNNYPASAWLKGHPLRDGFKQLRNDIRLSRYVKAGDGLSAAQLQKLSHHSPIVISIAFNKPAIIALLIEKFKQNVPQATLVIADNSNDQEQRAQIKQLCQQQQINYIPLPLNKTTHPNRSHGMAMQWCYERIINRLQPDIFGFIDHDLLPLAPVDIAARLGTQAFYGAKWVSPRASTWQLWAGYCFFRYRKVMDYPLNFLYDFSNGLDTGGRNYWALYRHFNVAQLTLAADQVLEKKKNGISDKIHRIDQNWLHLGGAGHRSGFDDEFQTIHEKLAFIERAHLATLEQAGYVCTTRHL